MRSAAFLLLLLGVASATKYYCASQFSSATCSQGSRIARDARSWGDCDTVNVKDIIIASDTAVTGYSCPGFTNNQSNCLLCAADNSRCPSLCQTTATLWQGSLPQAVVPRDTCTANGGMTGSYWIFSWPTTSTKEFGPCLSAGAAPRALAVILLLVVASL